MNLTDQTQQFCEQCGAHLDKDMRFCENCGTAVSRIPAATVPPRAEVRKASGKRTIVVVGALFVLLLIGASGWWVLRSRIDPRVTDQDQQALEITDHDANDSRHLGAIPTENDTRELPQPENPAAPLPAWVAAQPWYSSLSQSMPAGVTLSMMTEESEDPQWDLLTIREIHSPESGFDVDVSPTVGVFRINRDRKSTEWLDPVVDEWSSIAAFLSSRSIDGDVVHDDVDDAQGYTPAKGSVERTAICDAMRDFIIRGNRDRKLPKFLFKIKHISVSQGGDCAGFQGYPVKPDGDPLPMNLLGDQVYTTLLKKKSDTWQVVVDLSRSDVPSAEQLREIRNSIPVGFPSAVMPDFWRNLLKP